MFNSVRHLWRKDAESNETESRPSSNAGGQQQKTMLKEEPSGNTNAPNIVEKRSTLVPELIEIDAGSTNGDVYSVAFLGTDETVLSGDTRGNIRRWRMQDGKELGRPMNARSIVRDIAVSPDGKWVVGGLASGLVMIWDTTSGEKVTEIKGHRGHDVSAVDVSPDSTRIASGADDKTASVWTLPTGKRLVGPLKHSGFVVAAKFSPDGRFLATAAIQPGSVRIYDSLEARLVIDTGIQVCSPLNGSLDWVHDSTQLFALSHDGNICSLDPSNRSVSKLHWRVCDENISGCIALVANGRFIAATAGSTLSIWDATTKQKIGSTIDYFHHIFSIAISKSHYIAIAGKHKVTLRSLADVLPSSYYDNIFPDSAAETHATKDENDVPEVADDEIATLNSTVQQLTHSLHATGQENDSLNDIIISLRKDLMKETSTDELNQTVQGLRNQLAASDEEKKVLNQTIDSLRTELSARDESAKQTIQELSDRLADSRWIICAHEQRYKCEDLYARGRIYDAIYFYLEMANNMLDVERSSKFIVDWLTDFKRKCIVTLERAGDEALNAKKHDEAMEAYSAVLSLTPPTHKVALLKWAKMMLIHNSVDTALSAADQLKLPEFDVRQAICDALEGDGRFIEAVECFQLMQPELGECDSDQSERVQWELEFRQRCIEKLEKLGDSAMGSRNHGAAIENYSTALSLGPMNMNSILVKCCKARVSLLEKELAQANKDIQGDASSYKGYSRKHALLHRMGRHKEAFTAFKTMLSKIEQSPDPSIRKLRHRYIDATPQIRRIVQHTVRNMPRVLIDTRTGHHRDKIGQATAFEQLPVFDELRSSMITGVDEARIRMEVKKYYRYVMFSHRWEDGEPLFRQVEGISIYDLESSSPNIKLRTFCTIARALGFEWVWSDTCCIDKKDNVVLQESLVAMFTWYRGSSLTIIYLRGVWSQFAKIGDLRRSIWNTRAWTYQEYVAADTVQFYTEDWKPYLGLTMHNHKDSPDIIAEMQQAAGALTHDFAVHQPDLGRVREKLYVASMRETTVVEDVAYSLLGIFNASIPVIYGEGNRAVGRLLEHVLTGSGDVTILAWTGHSGSYNSCLPMDLTVYNELVPPHIPQPIESGEVDEVVAALRSSLPGISTALKLYGRLNELPSPTLAASRLRLYSIVFAVSEFVHVSGLDSNSESLHVYRATTAALGDVEVKTADDLTGMEDAVLIHPWISPLLDQDFAKRSVAPDDTTRALRLVARLRQPFGALLLVPLSRVQYRRVAADCLIMVRIREETSLEELMDGIRPVDIQ